MDEIGGAGSAPSKSNYKQAMKPRAGGFYFGIKRGGIDLCMRERVWSFCSLPPHGLDPGLVLDLYTTCMIASLEFDYLYAIRSLDS